MKRQSRGSLWRSFFLGLAFFIVHSSSAGDAVLKNAVIYLENFLTQTNFTAQADVLSVSPGSLKFRLGEKTFNYSGNFTIMLDSPRSRKGSFFSSGEPEKADFVILVNVFNTPNFPLKDPKIWERSKNFIVVEAVGKEFIHSGNFTVQSPSKGRLPR